MNDVSYIIAFIATKFLCSFEVAEIIWCQAIENGTSYSLIEEIRRN